MILINIILGTILGTIGGLLVYALLSVSFIVHSQSKLIREYDPTTGETK